MSVVNVRDYGALGNGVADDTAAIQAAQEDANRGHTAPLFFPNGKYPFNCTLNAKTILGENRQRTILLYTGDEEAVNAGAGIQYHRKAESFTLRGAGHGVGLALGGSPAGFYQNVMVEDFGTGVALGFAGAGCYYNVLQDVTVQSCDRGVVIDGESHENRFLAFRINHCTTGVDIISGGRNTFDASAVENTTVGVRITDPVPGRRLTRANVISSTRFEFCDTNLHVGPGVYGTAQIANRHIGGKVIDHGELGVNVDTNAGTVAAAHGVFRKTEVAGNDPALIVEGYGPHAVAEFSHEGERVGGIDRHGNIAAPQVYALSSYADARLQLTPSGATFDRNRADYNPVVRFNQIHEESTGNVAEFQKASTVMARVSGSGHLGVQASTEPTDVKTGEAVLWVDTQVDPPRLMIAVRDSTGAITSTPA